jgi:ferredoxin-type protein NapF
MAGPISRIQFLRGDFRGEQNHILPPWAVAGEAFFEICDRCGDCIPACEDGLIKIGTGGYPQIDFSAGGCDFCEQCAKACKPGVLRLDKESETPPWTLKASILDSCLSLNAIICRSCGEACDERAIRFQLELRGVARPLLDQEKCNGCGACFSICPEKSISIQSLATRTEAA